MSDETPTETAALVDGRDAAGWRDAFEGMRLATVSALKDKDAAYVERNRCVAALARAALGFGLRAWLGKHPAEDATWDPEWATIVFILLPAGLCSWHIHDSELPAFAFLVDQPPATPYDGHSTPEKYERLAAWEPRRG